MELDTVHTGDASDILKTLPDRSIHTCITSPPYWGLRDYSRCGCSLRRQCSELMRTFGGANRTEGLGGSLNPDDKRCQKEPDPDCKLCFGTGIIKGTENQLGLEKTPEAYVQKLVDIFREVRRVLRDDGTLWLNLGDSYMSHTGDFSKSKGFQGKEIRENVNAEKAKNLYFPKTHLYKTGLKNKDLVGIPWRVALALQADGWYLRSDIIWHKPNPMPESVTDRPTKSHEYVFLMSKSKRYYYDQEAVREEMSLNAHSRGKNGKPRMTMTKIAAAGLGIKNNNSFQAAMCDLPAGSKRNLRSVWAIATQPFHEAHFATFPEKLVEPCIKAGTSQKGCCPDCGEPWVRVIEKKPATMNIRVRDAKKGILDKKSGFDEDATEEEIANYKKEELGQTKTLGWKQNCTCKLKKPIKAVVLDPFMGSGTTAVVAKKLGRHFVGIELNPLYVQMTKKRVKQECKERYRNDEVFVHGKFCRIPELQTEAVNGNSAPQDLRSGRRGGV